MNRRNYLRAGIFAATVLFVIAAFSRIAPRISRAADAGLQIYLIDVEGGQSTLFVTPEKHALLIDTGFAANNGRDPDRIIAAAKKAGISKIDYVLITHWHGDHVGGAPELASKFPIGAFVDHGDNLESSTTGFQPPPEYMALFASKKYGHITAKPGATIPVAGMHVTIVSANTATIAKALADGGAENPACNSAETYPPDKTENHNSVGVVIEFGKLRILDLGDLTSDVEMKLMCPENKLGKIDVYIVSHHGSPDSGSVQLVNAIAPRVALMDNGAQKGGDPRAIDIVRHSPRLEDFWQLHIATAAGSDHNSAAEFIANIDGPDAGNYLEVIGHEDGGFAVFNPRTNKTKEYAAGPK